MAYGSALVDTIQSSTTGTPPQFNDGSGTQIGTLCRAWIQFTGGATPTVNASFNVGSITRGGTGNYTINFSSAMPDAKYAVMGSVNGVTASTYAGSVGPATTTALTASSAVISTFSLTAANAGSTPDATYISIAFFR